MEDTPGTFLQNTRLRFVSMVENLDLSDDTLFVEVLQAACATLGMNQKQVAFALGTSTMSLQRWLKSVHLPQKVVYRTAHMDCLCKKILS